MKHLVLIIDRQTNATLKEYPEIEAEDWYYARHIAADAYKKETGKTEGFYADSIEL